MRRHVCLVMDINGKISAGLATCSQRLKHVRPHNPTMSGAVYYHYTSVVTCSSMLQSQSLWLTDHRFLNDKHELSSALRRFSEHFSEAEQKALESALHTHSWDHHYCVFSLSKSAEILSQWRAYGDDGRGVAIGFYPPALKWAGLDLFECLYEDHEKYIGALAKKYKKLVREAAEAAAMRPPTIYEWSRENAKPIQQLIRSLVLLKNPAFREEQEVRGIHSPRREEMLFRTTSNSLVPYSKVIFVDKNSDRRANSLWVAAPEIWIGPRCTDLNRVALEMLAGSGSHWRKFDCGYV